MEAFEEEEEAPVRPGTGRNYTQLQAFEREDQFEEWFAFNKGTWQWLAFNLFS